MLCNLIRIQIMHLRTNFETNHKRNLWLLSLVCEYRCCFLPNDDSNKMVSRKIRPSTILLLLLCELIN